MKKRKGRRRTHKQLRAAGIDDAGVMSTATSVPPCLKMWFPMTETAGTTITDVVGGAVYTPTTINFGITDAVRIATNSQQALTSGTFPAIGTKDFIVLSVYYHDSDPTFSGATVRPEATLRFRNTGTTCFATFDGDGVELYDNAGAFQAGTETLCGSSGNGVTTDTACHALVRNSDSVGNWLENSTWNLNGSVDNDYVTEGELFARTMRVEGYGSPPNADTHGTANVGRNDLGISDAVINSYNTDSDGVALMSPITSQSGVGNISGGMPGVWVSTGQAIDIATPNTLQVGLGLAAHIHYYGIAIFVFDDGLPSDFKEALRWMKDQWVAGNKVIWPNWITQS